jgi:SAM-dependent methyltransferase
MSFYSEFAGYYERVFPFDEATYGFLRSRFPSGARRILDIGCGTGDYCGRLASQGYEALGIDLDRWMVERAKKKYPATEFRVLGLDEVGSLGGMFGAAFCIGNVAAHLPRHRLGGFLWALRERLDQGAIWIVQTVNWDYVLRQDSYTFPEVAVGESGLLFERSYPEISEEMVTFVTRLREREGVVFEGETTLYPVRAEDYIRAHREVEFELVGQYGGFSDEEFDPRKMSSSVLVFRRT